MSLKSAYLGLLGVSFACVAITTGYFHMQKDNFDSKGQQNNPAPTDLAVEDTVIDAKDEGEEIEDLELANQDNLPEDEEQEEVEGGEDGNEHMHHNTCHLLAIYNCFSF